MLFNIIALKCKWWSCKIIQTFLKTIPFGKHRNSGCSFAVGRNWYLKPREKCECNQREIYPPKRGCLTVDHGRTRAWLKHVHAKITPPWNLTGTQIQLRRRWICGCTELALLVLPSRFFRLHSSFWRYLRKKKKFCNPSSLSLHIC